MTWKCSRVLQQGRHPETLRPSHAGRKFVKYNNEGGRAPVEALAHRTSATVMQQFQIGDRVVVLPRFAHLYPGDAAVVVEVKLDPFREMFNEYKVEFPDGSTAGVFEFQMRKLMD